MPYLLNNLSYRSEISTQNRLRYVLQKMSAIGVSKNYFPKKKIKKNSFLDNFRVFLTPFVPYLINHLSYRSEIFTQNRLRAALQKKSTTGVSQNYFSKKKFKNSFSDDFQVFLTTFLPYLLNHLSYRSEIFTQNRPR